MNMANITEYAKDYVQTSATKNIADLPKVSTDLELLEDSFEFTKDGVTKTVDQLVVVVDEEQYRVPKSVIQQLKVLVEDNPGLKTFKVKKSGTTKDDTRYQVIPKMS